MQPISNRKVQMISKVSPPHDSLTKDMKGMLCEETEAFDELPFGVSGTGLARDARFVHNDLFPTDFRGGFGRFDVFQFTQDLRVVSHFTLCVIDVSCIITT